MATDGGPRRWPVALMLVGTAAAACLGAAGGAAAATAWSASQAASLARQGRYGEAVAMEDEIARRAGPLYLLDRSDVQAAAQRSQEMLLAWAAQLAGSGREDAAAALLDAVTQPSLQASVRAERAQVVWRAAQADAAQGLYAQALSRLDQLQTLDPPPSLAAQVAAKRGAWVTGEAAALVSAGRGDDAVALLGTAGGAGAQALPTTLLSAATQDLHDLDFTAALDDVQRLVTQFPSSAAAHQAEGMLRQGQPVSGTLVDRSGRPVTARVRLSSHFFPVPGGYYTTGPFFYASSDAHGDFLFPAIPLGGPYVLEVQRGSDWTTFVNPNTNEPAQPVTIAPLTPVDLAFIPLP